MKYQKEVVVMLLGLFLLGVCEEKKEEETKVSQAEPDLSPESLESASISDLAHDATIWRNWRPWKLWKLGRSMLNNGLTHSKESAHERRLVRGEHRGKLKNKVKFLFKIHQFETRYIEIMYYVDSQRTLTRRDSSLLASRKYSSSESRHENEPTITTSRPSATPFLSESGASFTTRPKGAIKKELITILFESMLDTIVASWEIIIPPKIEDSTPTPAIMKSPSEVTVISKRRKSMVGKLTPSQSSKVKRSKLELPEIKQVQIDPLYLSWWSSPDERAIIRFRNGNVYEGSISMKCMHGEGRFQWADGTVYLGSFKDNQINGKGSIYWKDDTWYEGEFAGNLRHGKGLYVDSRNQRSYAGGWYCGAKHGQGVIYYTKTFKNSYDGEWDHNVRHGYGSREYCEISGYKGEWDKYVREGKGLMIWPNHDFYTGKWKNGVMSGNGTYIWEAYYNNTLAMPSMNAYRGQWFSGQRNGYGVLNLGLGLGAHYRGDFENNKKHGAGKFVTSNGLILYDKKLFIDDNVGLMISDDQESSPHDYKQMEFEPYNFDIYDSSVGLLYHVEDAFKNIDKQLEIRANMISDYIQNNKHIEVDLAEVVRKEARPVETIPINMEDLIKFDEISLRKSLRCYETELKNIYYMYATILCDTEDVNFTPVLMRLYLWQFYFDCNIHDKGLNLVEIDKMFHRNPQWLSKSPHNPFEKIYFWQFIHSLISVASKLYAKRKLPGPKPDTILASAFRTFMETDVLPNVGCRKGRLVNEYGHYVPLTGLYKLYRSLNEPHTVRDFLRAVRRQPHNTDHPQPPLVETSDECVPLGRNVFLCGDAMNFVADDVLNPECDYDSIINYTDLKLFNFGNLSSKGIIKIFSNIFPQLCDNDKIMDLDIQMTFFEFFEAFIACDEESIRIKDEEIRWREKISETTGLAQAANVTKTK